MSGVDIIYRCGGEDSAARQPPRDPEAARERLDEGNRAFAALFVSGAGDPATAQRVIPISAEDFGVRGADSKAPSQRPFAAILGCADARVPIELVFNEGPNDLFVVRVAGNTLGDDSRGSLRYALDHLRERLKLIVVLGHSGCGAITAAVDVYLGTNRYFSLASQHSVRALVDRLQIVVHATATRLTRALGSEIARHPRYREALIEAAALTNTAVAASMIQEEIRAAGATEVRSAYGVYLLADRSIWAPRAGSAEVSGLAAPPAAAEGFLAFGEAVLASQRIRSILAQ